MSEPDDGILDEQLAYYGDRAPHYDDAYSRTGLSDRGAEANAAWFREMAVVEAAVDELELDGLVLELGCGTGHWTVRLARRAAHVTAVDGAAAMLDVARAKVAGAGLTNVELVHADIVRSWTPSGTGTFDAAAAFFFLEHVPDEHLGLVLDGMANSLRPGGRVVVAEGRQREPLAPGAEIEHRHLHGVQHRVVERRRSAEEFAAAFADHGIDVTAEHTARLFTIVRGVRR